MLLSAIDIFTVCFVVLAFLSPPFWGMRYSRTVAVQKKMTGCCAPTIIVNKCIHTSFKNRVGTIEHSSRYENKQSARKKAVGGVALLFLLTRPQPTLTLTLRGAKGRQERSRCSAGCFVGVFPIVISRPKSRTKPIRRRVFSRFFLHRQCR